MTEYDTFELRLADALRRYAAEAPSDVEPLAFTHAIAVAHPRRSRRAAVFTGGWRYAWLAVAAALLLVAIVAAILAARPQRTSYFESTGSLAVARSGHSAVLLHDGRVLVVGGWSERYLTPLPAEVYDPRTGSFKSLGLIVAAFSRENDALDEYQARFSATLLADGRVLFAGGRPGGGTLPPPPTAEAVLFDPGSGTSSPTGAMSVARAGHVAARLPDGRVLVVGGVGIGANGTEQSLASAELYDPVSETFSPTGSMATDRTVASYEEFDLAATVLPSGRVLVSGGGRYQRDPPLGSQGTAVAAPDEVYDPATGTFSSIQPDGSPENGTTLLLLRDLVYRYDLATGRATDITPQATDLVREFGHKCRDLPGDCRSGQTTTLLNDGRILVAGGRTFQLEPPGAVRRWRSAAWTTGEVLDPVSGAVTPTGPLVTPRSGHSATVLLDGRVVLIGGYAPLSVQSPDFLSAAEIFAP